MTITRTTWMSRVLAVLLVMGTVAFASAQSASAEAQATAFTQAAFYSADPNAGGELITRVDVSAAAQANVENAEYVVLEGADRAYTFALAAQARAEGELELAVENAEQTTAGAEAESMAFADVVARLEAAMRGEASLAVFTDGRPENGHVVGVFRIDGESGDAQVTLDGATHVVLFANGDAEVLEVRATGATLADVEVAAEGESDAEGIVDLGVSLDLDVSGSAGDGEAEGSAGIGIGVGIGGDDGDGDEGN